MLRFQNGERILFVGDSVTDAGRRRPVGEGMSDGVGMGYVRDIDAFLNVYYPENLYYIINMGVSGNTTKDLLERWQTDVIDMKPDRVIICIGFNDVWRQYDSPALVGTHILPEQYRANLVTLIEDTLPKVKEIILMTPYYLESNVEDLMRKSMDEYGSIVKELAGQYQLLCIDLQKEFNEYLKFRYPAYIMWDRIHPGTIGSLIIARTFLREIGFDRNVI